MRARRTVKIAVRLLVCALAFELLLITVVLLNHRRGDAKPGADVLAAARAAGGAEVVEFENDSGLTLRADLFGDPSTHPLVVFAHGYRDRRRQGDPLALDLLARGLAVLQFDFRGCGASDGVVTGAGALEPGDVKAALAYARTRSPNGPILYVGYSMGASAALLAPEAWASCDAIVLLAPYARLLETFEARTRKFGRLPLEPWFDPALFVWRHVTGIDPADVNPEDGARRLAPRPVLLIGTAADWRAPPSDLQRIAAALPGGAEVVILPDGDHFTLARLEPEVRRQVVEFLTRPGRVPDK